MKQEAATNKPRVEYSSESKVSSALIDKVAARWDEFGLP
jgi:hypothetical protein